MFELNIRRWIERKKLLSWRRSSSIILTWHHSNSSSVAGRHQRVYITSEEEKLFIEYKFNPVIAKSILRSSFNETCKSDRSKNIRKEPSLPHTHTMPSRQHNLLWCIPLWRQMHCLWAVRQDVWEKDTETKTMKKGTFGLLSEGKNTKILTLS